MADKNYDFFHKRAKFEKLADSRMSRYSADWEMEISKKLVEELPYVVQGGNYVITFKEVDSDRGYGFGSVAVVNAQGQSQVHNREDYNATGGPASKGAPIAMPTKRAFIPIIIKDFKLSDLDIFVVDGQPRPLTEHNWGKVMSNNEVFGSAVRTPSLSRYSLDETANKTNPPYASSSRYQVRSTGMFAYSSEGMKKTGSHGGSLMDEILPTISKEHRDMWRPHVGCEENLAPFMGTRSLEIIDKVMRGEPLAPEDALNAVSGSMAPNIIRIRDLGGKFEVTLVSDEIYDPKIMEMTIDQVLKSLGDLVPNLGEQLSTVKFGSDLVIAVNHQDRALVLLEDYAVNPQPITKSGDYCCLTSGGDLACGYVCTDVYEANGDSCGHSLFIGGDKWAFQGMMFGDANTEPTDVTDGMLAKRAYGTFLYNNNGVSACMVPFQVVGVSEREGHPMIQVIDAFANPITFVIMPGIQKCVSLTGNMNLGVGGLVNANLFAIPESYQFINLGKRMTIMSDPEEISRKLNTKVLVHWADAKFKKELQVGDGHEAANVLTIKKADNQFKMEGPSVAMIHKDAAGTLVNEQTAIFYLTVLGASIARAKEILDRCRGLGRVTVANAKDLSLGLTKLNTAKGIYSELEAICKDLRKNLIKEAADLATQQRVMASYRTIVEGLPADVQPNLPLEKKAGELAAEDSVDTLLSLSFINPENLSTYLSNLERMEQTEEDLAQLLILVRLGLDNVNELSVKNAMKNLSDVIESLKFVNYLIKNKRITNG